MVYPNIKQLWLITAVIAVAGILLQNPLILLLSVFAFSMMFLSQLSERRNLVVRKIKFNQDSQKFEVFVENTGARPVWFNYVIRSVEATPVENVGANVEGGVELMRGNEVSQRESYMLLSDYSLCNPVDCGKLTLIEVPKVAADGMWNPQADRRVYFTATYTDELSSSKRFDAKIPIEVSGTHPYLRKIGVAREFVLTSDAGVVGKAGSLREMALHARENAPSALKHLKRGDVEKWIRDVVRDRELADEISTLAASPEEEIPDKISQLIERRIVELSYGDFLDTHPLLSEVEPWHAFQIKSDHSEIVGEARSLHSLLAAVKASPANSIKFHLKRGNDFARWAENVIGDAKLSQKLDAVDASDPKKAQLVVSNILSQRIAELGG